MIRKSSRDQISNYLNLLLEFFNNLSAIITNSKLTSALCPIKISDNSYHEE